MDYIKKATTPEEKRKLMQEYFEALKMLEAPKVKFVYKVSKPLIRKYLEKKLEKINDEKVKEFIRNNFNKVVEEIAKEVAENAVFFDLETKKELKDYLRWIIPLAVKEYLKELKSKI